LAALSISTATAFAASPVITGDAQTMLQVTKGNGDYSDVRLRLNFDQDMGDGMYAHARIMGIDQQGFGHNYAEAGTGSTGSAINMEQLYIGAKLGSVDMKFGRQPLSVGQNMLADLNGIEGISAAATTGDFNVYGFAGRSGTTDTMAANISTNVDGVNLGASYLSKEDTKYWSVNGATKINNNIGLSGIYMNNTTDDANGFMVKATVGTVAKKGDFNYAVSYRDIENNAVDGNWVTNGALADSKGIRLETNYKLTNNANLWVYKDITRQSSNTAVHPNQFRAEIDVNF
jgi:hypothetical protein